MFCDRCGAALQPDQRFCGRCGREFSGNLAVARAVPNRVQEHVRLLGILWLALSALEGIGGVVLCIVGSTLFPHLREMGAPPETPVGFLHSFVTALGVIVLVKAALGLIAGWGLLRHESWGRLLTIVLAVLALLNIPFGTALGIYSLWVLLPAQSELEYERAAASADLR